MIEEEKQPKKRKKKKLPVAIDLDEFTELLRVTEFPRHKLAFLLAWASSLRVSEVINVEERDVDMDKKRILIREGKGSKDRIVPLPKGFRVEHLKMLPLKKSCKQRALQKAFKKYAEQAGILDKKPTAHFHSLRHGFATHCIEKDIDITRVRDLMGHDDIGTTSKYTHLNPKIALNDYQEKF